MSDTDKYVHGDFFESLRGANLRNCAGKLHVETCYNLGHIVKVIRQVFVSVFISVVYVLQRLVFCRHFILDMLSK